MFVPKPTCNKGEWACGRLAKTVNRVYIGLNYSSPQTLLKFSLADSVPVMQADFDLCTECFNNGKFGSDMSPSDFIIMEPAEAGGASSGKWTDQETLLLLEALELFKENWNEIAEHVATKTKTQCILHFVQMPIEDTFLDSGEENADAVQQSNNENLATKDATEMTENKGNANDDQTSSSPIENSKLEEVNESNDHEVGENIVLKALKESFEVVGSVPSPIERFSFAEAGNPVMALVCFPYTFYKLFLSVVSPKLARYSTTFLISIGNFASRNFPVLICI